MKITEVFYKIHGKTYSRVIQSSECNNETEYLERVIEIIDNVTSNGAVVTNIKRW